MQSVKLKVRDGRVYAGIASADVSEPRIITNYYELALSAADWWEFTVAEIDAMDATISMPGEIYARFPEYRFGWGGCHVSIVGRGAAKPSFTEFTDVPPPRVRKGTQIWWNGYKGQWFKRTAKGGAVAC